MANAALKTAGVHVGRPLLRYLIRTVTLTFLLSGCIPGRRSPITPTGPINASAIPAASPTAITIYTPRPRPTSGPCANDSEFVADETIPDGTQVEPGAAIDKRWRVRNSGTCDWGPNYKMERINGPPMGTDTATGLYPARAGAEIELQILLTAPGDPGEHTTTWRMRDAQGEFFGDVLFVTIVVAEAPPSPE